MNDISKYVEAERCNVDFISLASHELRSPLTTMLLVADLIQEGGTPEELQRHWQILRTELEREKNLVERLLMVGRLESGDLKLRFTTIDISKEIKKSIQAIQPIAAAKNITIKASLSKSCLQSKLTQLVLIKY
jgi:signal transduction histidine kinase